MQIITGVERRRRWQAEDKLRIAAELEQPGACCAEVGVTTVRPISNRTMSALSSPSRTARRPTGGATTLYSCSSTTAALGSAKRRMFGGMTSISTAPRQVRLRGKGKKERLLPVWRETADALHHLRGLGDAGDRQHVFANRQRQPLTRDGVAYILSKYTAAAAKDRPQLARKKVTPHVLRHSCAVALLQSGADVTVIRDYLGHAGVATTGRYIATNLQMKREAMDVFWTHAGIERAEGGTLEAQVAMLAFLRSL